MTDSRPSRAAAILRGIPTLTRELFRSLRASIKGEPDRKRAALAWVQSHAKPGNPDSVLEALDDFARTQRFLMNVGPVKGLLLDECVERVGRKARILELGCFCGYSAVRISRHLAGGRLFSVEKSPASVEVARQVVDFAGLGDRVEILQGASSERIPDLQGPFDLVFIDHHKPLYLPDLQALESHHLLREGSVVFADNVGPLFGAQEYLGYVRGCGHYDTQCHHSTVEYTELEDDAEISVYRGVTKPN
jgi:catechol O-methyltransferase